MPPKRKSPGGGDAASRAAALLAKARNATANAPASLTTPRRSATTVKSEVPDTSTSDRIPLNTLLSHLSSEGGIPMREALPIAGSLIKGGFFTASKLQELSLVALEDLGITGENAKKTVKAFRGARIAGIQGTPNKRRRVDVFQAAAAAPRDGADSEASSAGIEYRFNEILDEPSLQGKYVVVNRAPVMTAWATVLLERMAFKRDEALSVAQCYVAHTSLARGVAIGEIPRSEADRAKQLVGANQPRFELMGVQVPVMQLQDGSWRGISAGDVMPPDKAFQYMRRSFNQTLPLVIGALSLLADSYINPPGDVAGSEGDENAANGAAIKSEDNSPPDDSKPDTMTSGSKSKPLYGVDALHEVAYSLYTDFRPETHGQWGKMARLQVDKVLALRKGHEDEWADWQRREGSGLELPPQPPPDDDVEEDG